MLRLLARGLNALESRMSAAARKLRARSLGWRRVGVKIGRAVEVGPRLELKCTDRGELTICAEASLGSDGTLIIKQGSISIGERSFIGRGFVMVAQAGISLGRDCLIAERVTIRDQDHAIHGRLEIPIAKAGFRVAPVIIGDGAWIGAGAVILKGVSIGKGAVVAANAVVTRTVADHEIVGGVPARHLGVRKGNDA